MTAQSQSVQYEMEGLFESPHDNPPTLAVMLTAYFDESFESPTGYAVVAGWVGDKQAWESFAEEWPKAIYPRKHLHMSELRWRGERHKALLASAGKVPLSCNLQPVFASVRVSDYKDKIKDYKSVVEAKGYYVAAAGAVTALLWDIRKQDRAEVIFEQQREFIAPMMEAMDYISRDPLLKKRGRRVLAKWSFAPKCIFLEPADYLAYAIMQQLVDPDSLKARLCSPILSNGPKRIGGTMPTEEVMRLLEDAQ
jgi:hypothetical protein